MLPALRKTGQFAQPDTDKPDAPGDAAGEAVRHRLDLVHEARILFGAARARSLWHQLGLPAVPPPPLTPRDEAYQCLRQLLDSPTGNGVRVRDLLANVLEDDEEARLLLLAVGIRVMPEHDTFVVANRHRGLEAIFKPTAWSAALEWMRVLRRLPGAQACGPARWSGPLAPSQPLMRGTLLPGDLLYENAR